MANKNRFEQILNDDPARIVLKRVRILQELNNYTKLSQKHNSQKK